mgnify:CR=1 FL=1
MLWKNLTVFVFKPPSLVNNFGVFVVKKCFIFKSKYHNEYKKRTVNVTPMDIRGIDVKPLCFKLYMHYIPFPGILVTASGASILKYQYFII